MRLLFIRHGIATDREKFEGEDLDRPLTDPGEKKARAGFKGLSRIFDRIDLVYSSQARRAIETAELLSKRFGGVSVIQTEHLNPGADFEDFRNLMNQRKPDFETVALVGHEPDLSDMIAGLVGGGAGPGGHPEPLHLHLKKCSCAEVRMIGLDAGLLAGLYAPRVLRTLAGVTAKKKKS